MGKFLSFSGVALLGCVGIFHVLGIADMGDSSQQPERLLIALGVGCLATLCWALLEVAE